MGSPSSEGAKKEVFKFRSVNNIVIASARTERDRSRRIAVIRIDQTVRYLCDSRPLIISPNRIYEKSMNPRDVDC